VKPYRALVIGRSLNGPLHTRLALSRTAIFEFTSHRRVWVDYKAGSGRDVDAFISPDLANQIDRSRGVELS
jgi:hypothetical protein